MGFRGITARQWEEAVKKGLREGVSKKITKAFLDSANQSKTTMITWSPNPNNPTRFVKSSVIVNDLKQSKECKYCQTFIEIDKIENGCCPRCGGPFNA